MPTLTENKQKWDGTYHWKDGGNHWSEPWGDPTTQWHATLWPRLRGFLPAGRVLEIAPGFGRWTAFLKDHCRELLAVDLAERCAAACRRRFEHDSHVRCYCNDGRSLDMAPDRSLDFVFSFDSLVHVEQDVIAGYLGEIARTLADEGAAFLHHSNLGSYRGYMAVVRGVPGLKLACRAVGLETKDHGRGRDVSAASVARVAEAVGLRCIRQELINWRSNLCVDCLTVLVRPGSSRDGQRRVIRNRGFMNEARQSRLIHQVYGGLDRAA